MKKKTRDALLLRVVRTLAMKCKCDKERYDLYRAGESLITEWKETNKKQIQDLLKTIEG